MPAETQSAPAQSAKVQFDTALEEQQRLRATLTADELAADHARKVADFLAFCEEASREAGANGLTEEVLAEILAEK